MITIIKAPALNRVLLDANNTEITIQSSNGSGYYFRAVIKVDDLFFDEQGWSRNTTFEATKDLVKLYNAYFESVFSSYTENAIVEQTHLKKKISITIHEHYIESNAIVATKVLPDFYFIYNSKPVYFDDTTKIQILGITPPVLQIPKNGKMRIPFYVKAVEELVTVEVKDNFGTIINTQRVESFTGKKIFQFQFDLAGVILAKNTIYFETTITCGTAITQLRYRLMNLPDYQVK
jgi:hypothetical protein